MKKIVFAVGDLRLGGTQRVQSVIANELFLNNYDVSFFSFIKFKSYFEILVNVIYSKYAIGLLEYIFILCSMMFRKFILKKDVDIILIPSKKDIEDFIIYIEKNNIETVILVEQWVLAANEIKKALPELKVIGWIHSSATIYESFLFVKSYDQLISGYKACDVLLALTSEDKDYLARYTKDNVKVMHNPLTIQNKKISDLNSKMISFVGRIDIHTKGLDYLIEIAKHLEDGWQIHVAGKGGRFEEFKFRKMINDARLQNKIILQGSKNGKELEQHYLNSSIFISLSRFEGFGLVSVEAMSFGLPVISFSNSGSREIIDNGKYGILVEQGNIKEFCNQLKLLMDSKEKRKKYQQLSLKRVELFNLKNVICKWEGII